MTDEPVTLITVDTPNAPAGGFDPLAERRYEVAGLAKALNSGNRKARRAIAARLRKGER